MFSLHGGLSDRFHKRVTGLRVTFKRVDETIHALVTPRGAFKRVDEPFMR